MIVWYDEVCKVKPGLVNAFFPVKHEAVDDSGAIELSANGVEDETCVDREWFGSKAVFAT